MPNSQTILLFASWVVHVLSPFHHMNIINSCLGFTCVVFSIMESLKKDSATCYNPNFTPGIFSSVDT